MRLMPQNLDLCQLVMIRVTLNTYQIGPHEQEDEGRDVLILRRFRKSAKSEYQFRHVPPSVLIE